MKTVALVLAGKRPGVLTVEADEMVLHALGVMDINDVGALLVMSGGKPAGIITERDYARKVVLRGKASITTKVREIMSPKVISVTLEQTVEECMAIMTERRIRHLPVIGQDGAVVGLLSIGDLVKAVISEQAFIISQLEHYITH